MVKNYSYPINPIAYAFLIMSRTIQFMFNNFGMFLHYNKSGVQMGVQVVVSGDNTTLKSIAPDAEFALITIVPGKITNRNFSV